MSITTTEQFGNGGLHLLRGAFFIAISVYLVGQALFPDIERRIYWGEFLTIANAYIGLAVVYRTPLQKSIVQCVYVWILFLPLYGIAVTYVMWPNEYIGIYMLRHMSIFYYATFFVAAFVRGDAILDVIGRSRVIVLAIFSYIVITGLGTTSSVLICLLWMAYQKRNQSHAVFIAGYIMIALTFALRSHGGMGKLIFVFLTMLPPIILFIRFYVSYTPELFLRYLTRGFFLVLLGLGFYYMGIFAEFMYEFASTGQSLGAIANDFTDESFGAFDGNVMWRLVFWAHLLDRFLHFLYGIGLGTPIVGPELYEFLLMSKEPDLVYTVGAHNSFVTVVVRLGIMGALVLLYGSIQSGRLMFSYLRAADYRVIDTPQKRYVSTCVMTFIVAVLICCFNVILESPIAAAYFWFAFGLFARLCGDFVAYAEDSP